MRLNQIVIFLTLLSAVSLICPRICYGQPPGAFATSHGETAIYRQFDRTAIDSVYMDNATALQKQNGVSTHDDTAAEIIPLLITTISSTDRTPDYNRQLARSAEPDSDIPCREGVTEIPGPAVESSTKYTKAPLFAVKTNLLFDLATILNVEVEVPIGPRWSVAGEWVFPWWLSGSRQRCLQLVSGTLEGRYWFGRRDNRPRMTGWFAGLYASGGYYDLEWDKTGYQGEFFIAAGLSGGYAHPLGKYLRMEYSLGIGYLKTDYRRYDAIFSRNDTQWHLIRRESGQYSWFGPTRMKISLVWMLNRNIRKGGMK